MDDPQPPSSTRPFKRTYVACSSCRAHKSRCIIKDHPPCSKCQREHRECIFDKKSRGPKHRAPPKWTAQSTAMDAERASESAMLQNPPSSGGTGTGISVLGGIIQPATVSPQTFGMPGTGATAAASFQGDTPGSNASPNTTHPLYDRVRTSAVTNSNDALDILSDAARLHHPQDTLAGPRHLSSRDSDQQALGPRVLPRVTPGGFNGLGFTITTLSQPDDRTLDFWDKCRFVRQGWFTAQEAVTYIDLYVLFCSPGHPRSHC